MPFNLALKKTRKSRLSKRNPRKRQGTLYTTHQTFSLVIIGLMSVYSSSSIGGLSLPVDEVFLFSVCLCLWLFFLFLSQCLLYLMYCIASRSLQIPCSCHSHSCFPAQEKLLVQRLQQCHISTAVLYGRTV